MYNKRSFWKILALFFIPILLALLASQFAAIPWAQRLLNQKLDELQQDQIARQNELKLSLREQVSQFSFNCGETDMALLRNPRFYNDHVRIQGLWLSSGKGCSSLGPDVPAQDLGLSANFFSDLKEQQNGVSATLDKFNTEQELIAFYHLKGHTIYWVFNNSWAHRILATPCEGCFLFEFSARGDAPTSPIFSRGDRAIKLASDPLTSSTDDPTHMFSQMLWGGDKLIQYAKRQITLIGAGAGALIGLLLVIAYWLRHNHLGSLKNLLEIGLAQREFIPFYQPVVDSRSGQVIGFEALLRWQKGKELVSPHVFIDYAEECGLIMPMTEQLLEQVLEDLDKLGEKRWISINLVAAHIDQPVLRTWLEQQQWPNPERLAFELTERTPITDINHAAQEISELQKHGYHCKLDDFGTGYGGFAYLQQLGIHQIKIDKMFVDTIGTTDLKRSVLDAIIASGHGANMEMIAEGVESQEQADYLQARGVHLIQGYVYSKPLPLAQLLPWLTARRQHQL